MDHEGNTSTTTEPSDDDPDLYETSGASTSKQQQKARVRFNSRAGARQPQDASAQSPDQGRVPSRPPPPPILRGSSRDAVPTFQTSDQPNVSPKDAAAAAAAQDRGNAMANLVWRSYDAEDPQSPFASVTQSISGGSGYEPLESVQDIALQPLGQMHCDTEKCSTDQYTYHANDGPCRTATDEGLPDHNTDTNSSMTTEVNQVEKRQKGELEEIFNGYVDGSYRVPPPEHYRGGVLSQLLKLYKQPSLQSARNLLPPSPKSKTPDHRRTPSLPGTGTTTPERRKWYEQNDSQTTLTTLIQASTRLAKPACPDTDGTQVRHDGPRISRAHKQTNSISHRLSNILRQEEVHVKVHIAGTIARQDFIVKLCQALMLYGAPTHRLEEYLTMTARALEIEAQFLYIPGCMLISFDDAATHTTEVKLVRLAQGIDLGRLKDVHRTYKEVIHDVIGVEEATVQLEGYMAKKPKFHPWFRVLIFGLTSVTAAPFSFHARMIDLPLCFFFGCIVGALQLILAPKLPLYSNVFEVSATVLVSFLARAFGSIRGGNLFCFSALAQGGIVMLLPGYMFLSSSLELQARAIVPGSIRIVYGVIYSLLLGFGITIGAALYGLADSNATSALTCTNPIPSLWAFIFVPPFVLCISILYQAKWKQIPIMVTVAFAGYVVNYYSSQQFPSSPQIASTLGAFAVGVLANLYSRFRHGVAAAILIPAIFTQVPGSLASQGGLLSGLQVANEINNATGAALSGASSSAGINSSTDSVVFNVAGSMIQIAIGITVGLFLSALLVYPLGKRRSGLFSF